MKTNALAPQTAARLGMFAPVPVVVWLLLVLTGVRFTLSPHTSMAGIVAFAAGFSLLFVGFPALSLLMGGFALQALRPDSKAVWPARIGAALGLIAFIWVLVGVAQNVLHH